jgi:hypothetical protein
VGEPDEDPEDHRDGDQDDGIGDQMCAHPQRRIVSDEGTD